MPDKFILLSLAPWPTLLSLVRQEPRNWIVWGSLPRSVCTRFRKLGIEVRDEALPRPFHRAILPTWVQNCGRGVVVPALGHPLPTRWPVVRRVASSGARVFIAKHGQMKRVHDIPATDAFTWALDAGSERVRPTSKTSFDFACVRADLLGDLLLSMPALTALTRLGSVLLITRQEWKDWLRELLPNCQVRGLHLAPWDPPCFDAAETSVDMSPPGWLSPLTPALARAVPANVHKLAECGNDLSEMIALSLGLKVLWPARKSDSGFYGVFVPTGSSLERLLPEDSWRYVIKRVSETMGLHSWIVVDPEGQASYAKWMEVSDMQTMTGYRKPSDLINLIRGAAIVVGVSTALTHLAALAGTPALIVEHPTTAPGMYRAPVSYIRYIRPSAPWWCDNPSEGDLDLAMAEQPDSYGFLPGEWRDAIEEAIAAAPLAGLR